ncbi:MAG TPA: hypothetical protein VI461_08525, partial [Chitinophagaceae bacterium]|nr:hypothetical protein [Chitinophagaceae bacterium]
MNNSQKVPDYIRKGAAGRIREKLNEQKEACYKIASKDRPMDAEEEKPRKIAYIKREVGVTDSIAERIANYENLRDLPISEEKKSKAESIQGSTMDFMGIYFADLCRAASRSVARIIFPDGSPQGTGFMISPELFITNNHVISTKEAAQSFRIE